MPLRHRLHEGTALDNTVKTILTFAGNLTEGGAITWGFIIVNNDAVDHSVAVYIVPDLAAAANVYLKFHGSIPAGESVAISGPYHNASKAVVQAQSDAAAPATTITVTCSEEYQG